MRPTTTRHENFVRHTSIPWSVQVATSPCGAMAFPAVLSASLSQEAWAMIPAGRQGRRPVSAPTSSAFPKSRPWVGFPQRSAQRLHRGGRFESVPMPAVQASWFARHPGLSSRCGQEPQGSRDCSVRAEPVLFPSQASDMLAVRIRQLTAEDFHLMRLAVLSAAPGIHTRWTMNEVSWWHRILQFPSTSRAWSH
jgi:hypothetical protein